MTTGRADRLLLYEEIVQRLSGALRAARLYSPAHPTVADHIDRLLEAVRKLHAAQDTVLIGFVTGEIIADDTPLTRTSASRTELTRELEALGIHRLLLERGVALEEVARFVEAVATATPAVGARPAEPDTEIDFLALPHLRAGRIPIDTGAGEWGTSAVTVRRTYTGSIAAARDLWEGAKIDGRMDLAAARDTVEHLAEAVSATRLAMLGLTGMKEHDEYTFTHMVNVSILTMAQAGALGIDGDELRSLGLAGLLHDIGKVRTPADILTKAAALTDREMALLRRHPIDGAAILRRTRGMPRIAPIVAFEHHLRLDGTGYPEAVARRPLNLATMLCGIADVYDAMRSQRQYQEAFPTDRIIAVLQRNDGRQFDQHLVRRFVHLMGIYPPGTLVRLDSGEVGVVLRPGTADPERPTVRVLFDATGAPLPEPEVRQLVGPAQDGGGLIAAPVDPADFDLDPVAFLLAA